MESTKKTALRDLARTTLERYPEEAAAIVERSPVNDAVELLSDAPAQLTAALFRKVTPDAAARIVSAMEDETAARAITETDPSRAATIIARLAEDRRLAILAHVDDSLEKELNELATYPTGSAGNLMDPRVLTFRPDASRADVFRRLRHLREKKVQEVYLVDGDGRLVGYVPLQDVILASSTARLADLSSQVPPHVLVTDSREEVSNRLSSTPVTALPVVDYDQRLLGVIRQKELLGATQQAATADVLKMVGASREERALSPALFAVKKRLPWLEVNLLTAFLAAAVVGIFEGTIAKFTALAVLLPVVAGQSGNTGAQALAVTMRGLALREIRLRHWLRVSSKELAVGAINGVAVALTTSAAVLVWTRSPGIAFVIGVSMIISMTVAGFAGAVIPMILTSLKQDPAQSSSIFLTTVTDVVGFFSFLGIATLLAPML